MWSLIMQFVVIPILSFISNILIQPVHLLFTWLFGKSFTLAFPWLQRFLFERIIVMTSEKTLKKLPLKFYQPNILLIVLFVVGINVLKFLIMWFFTEDKIFQLIYVSSVSIVTIFFLFKDFSHSNTKRERIAFFVLLLVLFFLFVVFLFGFNVWWLAFIVKVTIEVVFCAAVMLVELNILNRTQEKIISSMMRVLKISPDSRIGKLILRLSFTKNNIIENTESEKDNIISTEDDIRNSDGT